MKRQTLAKSSLLIFIILAVIGIALASFARKNLRLVWHSNRGGQELSADNRPLKEQAKEKGRYIATEEPKDADRCSDLAELTKRSTAVIIGIPQQNVSNLSADGKHITIDYKVKVEYVYKGSIGQGSIINVSLPGGMVSFEDKTTAEIRTPWFKKMQDGKTYLLFLTERASSGSFIPTGGPQGLFEIPTDGTSTSVKVHTGIANDPMWKYQDMDVRLFLKEVKKTIRENSKN